MKTDIKPFEATPAQIASWKKEHGADQILKLVIIPTDDKNELPPAVAYCRKPTIVELILAEQTGQNSIIQEGEILLNNCWLGGDEIVRTHTAYKLQACLKAHSLTERMVSTLEKI
jgi:hypothetical protein